MSGLLARSQILRHALRLGVALGLLYLAVRIAVPSDGPSIADTLAAAWIATPAESLAWLGLAWGILGTSLAVGTLRFFILLRAGGLVVQWNVLFRAYLVATFLNLVLPSAVLGDAYRVWDARRDTGSGSEVLGLLVFERLLALSALGVIGLLAAPVIPLAAEDGYLAWLLIAVSSALFLGTLAALYPRTNRLIRRCLTPLERISARLSDTAQRALAAVAGLSKQPAVVLRAFLLSLVAQALPVAAVYALAVPLDSTVAWYWFAVIVPFVTLVSLVPISIGGAGVREYLYVALFGAAGMKAGSALALSLSILAAAMGWAIVGFVIFALQRRRGRGFRAAQANGAR